MEPPRPRARARSESVLAEVVAALSHALDLTEGQPRGHAGRTCLLGMRLARDIGLTDAELSSLYYALLLKDAGCSSSAARMSEIFGGADDLDLKRDGKLVDFTSAKEALRFVHGHTGDGNSSGLRHARETIIAAIQFARAGGNIVEARCDRGARIVAELGFPRDAAEAVRALDEHWDGKGRPGGLRGDQIPILARIACLAQTADVFLTAYGLDAGRSMVRGRSGTWFDPELAQAFLAIPPRDPIWAQRESASDPEVVVREDPTGALIVAGEAELDRIADAFADVIDAKSPYTSNHSRGVAVYAVAIARQLGVAEHEVRVLHRAALLHDIGKLGVSNSILDKPGKLTDEEFAVVRLHPRFTEEILLRVSAFAPIAFPAGAHHERIDGRGYHRGIGGEDLPRDARILAVADVFDALYSDRPYRDGMPIERILAILQGDIGTAFDGDCVAALVGALDTKGIEFVPAAEVLAPV